ncbi:MAG: hypothetical protein FGM57_03590 [Candidatus Taylorbacteria bacterium]|nr:hypothetical protein [Candidatus Taylorbacteria bacterium]
MSKETPNQESEVNPEWLVVADEYAQKINSIPMPKRMEFMFGLPDFERQLQGQYPGINLRRVFLFHTMIGSTPMYEAGFDMLDLPGDEIKNHIDEASK